LFLTGCIAGPAMLTPAASSEAAFSEVLAFQGVLTDDLGDPLPNADYNLTFRIYDVDTGGSALWTETISNVSVLAGQFGVVLGATNPIALSFDRPYWLGIQVGAEAEITDRTPLLPVAQASALGFPVSGSASTSDPAFRITNTGSGAALTANGSMDIGGSIKPGGGRWYLSGTPQPVSEVLWDGLGTAMYLRDPAGQMGVRLEPHFHGVGGYLELTRPDGTYGFYVGSNHISYEDPVLELHGTSTFFTLDTKQTGDGAIEFPPGSVDATELANEPGVASTTGNGPIAIGTSLGTLLSRSITVPSAGYVLVLGTAELDIGSGGADVTVNIGVSTTTTLPLEQNRSLVLETGTHSFDLTDFPVTLHGIFGVSAGTSTLRILARRVSGTFPVEARDLQLTIIFMPTAYGPIVSQGTGTALDDGRLRHPTSTDWEAERIASEAAALAFRDQRIERELEELQARTLALRERVAGGSDPEKGGPQ
jgi:hypothetical protein